MSFRMTHIVGAVLGIALLTPALSFAQQCQGSGKQGGGGSGGGGPKGGGQKGGGGGGGMSTMLGGQNPMMSMSRMQGGGSSSGGGFQQMMQPGPQVQQMLQQQQQMMMQQQQMQQALTQLQQQISVATDDVLKIAVQNTGNNQMVRAMAQMELTRRQSQDQNQFFGQYQSQFKEVAAYR